jgi:hypothetical protein
MVGEIIYDITGGNIYLVMLGVFLIFYLDSMWITLLPEVLILFFFAIPHPDVPLVTWALLLLLMANLGDVTGNYTVYILFKKWDWFHKKVSAKLRKYVGFLLLKDEKLILLNRLAPAIPMCGVFIAACDWDIKRALFYIYLGGLIKYSIILIIFGFLDWLYDPDVAFWITLISVIAFLIPSFFLGRRKQKRLLEIAKKEQEAESKKADQL